jgi:hypothetical protein
VVVAGNIADVDADDVDVDIDDVELIVELLTGTTAVVVLDPANDVILVVVDGWQLLIH